MTWVRHLFDHLVVFFTNIFFLVRALDDNLIGAVGLDVTTPEPLPPAHKLYSFPNCLILPHVGSATYETRENMAGMTLQNILAGLDHSSLPYSI